MVETEAHGTTGSGNSALPTELQTLAKVGLLENQWRLVKPIGQGQSGVVWEAHDISLDRRVAVKVMHQATAESPGQVARFERETRVLATLEHPNLTPVLGSGRLGGRPFVVMRLLLGRTLAELMHARGGKLTEAEAAYCLLPVCDALAALHEAKVVHRDLKPSNVFVSDDGTVTLLDLGQAFETGSELTRTGEMHGNAEYLSPEQIAGRGVDPQSDVYALGCLLHELLLGRPPFTGELAEVLEQHGSAPRPTALALGSGPLAEVLVRMLQVDPRARPALGEVRAALVPFAPAQLQLPAMALPRTRTSDKHRVARGLSDTAIPAARVREGAAPLGAGAQAGTTRDRWQGQHAEDEPTTATERPVPREAPTDRDVALPREAATRRAGAERPEEPPTAPGLALPRLPPAAEEETAPVRVSRAVSEPDATRLQPGLSPREKSTRPVERPLSRSALVVMGVAAVALLAFVGLGLLQGEPPAPPPVRVDRPQVPVVLPSKSPVAEAAAPSKAGPPPQTQLASPAPSLPLLEERKTFVNAAPTTASARRGRPPNLTPPGKGYFRIITTVGGDEVPCHLEIDGKKVGDTPYLSPLLRQGEHLLHAVCLGWPAEELIWPFPSPDRQKLGMLVEIPVGTLADTETREANRPMQDESLSSNSGTSCPKGKPCAPPKH